MDIIFKLAIFFIPFDNVKFAPSGGWAAISPVIFLIYCLLNFKNLITVFKIEIKKVSVISLILIWSSVIAVITGNLDFHNYIHTLLVFILGITFYVSLVIRYYINKNDIKKDLNYLLIGYGISIFYGITKYISIKFNLDVLNKLYKIIEYRTATGKVAFTFTEPSFITMHVFGILFLLFLLFRYYDKDNFMSKRISKYVLIFIILAIGFKSSTRFVVDFVVILIISGFYFVFLDKNIKARIKVAIVLVLIVLMPISYGLIKNNPRLNSIVRNGIYADGSLASRYFRINATIKGYEDEPLKFITGTGMGSAYYFLNLGYDNAFKEYKSNFLVEVQSLKNTKDYSIFCMPLRVIDEFGFLIFVALLISIVYYTKRYKGNFLALVIIGYLYIQFDSYAFYSIWIFLFFTKYSNYIFEKKEEIDL